MGTAYTGTGSDLFFDGRGVARDRVGRPVRAEVSVSPGLRPEEVDLERSPVLVLWVPTRAREGCRVCGVEPRPYRDPDELSTLDAMRLMNDIRTFGPVSLVLTGGDPLRRPDLSQLVSHGARIGLRMGLSLPCGVGASADLLRSLRRSGLGRISIRLHGVPVSGAGDSPDSGAVRTLLLAGDVGLATQAETKLDVDGVETLDPMADALVRLGVGRWSVSVPVDADAVALGAVAAERAIRRLSELGDRLPLHISVTGAPQARRIALQRAGVPATDADRPALGDGRGVLFVGHDGAIRPARRLPPGGMARTDDVAAVYRSGFFRAFRDRERLKGKCGICEYRSVCGGSRARALAVTGDALEADPLCPYLPKGRGAAVG